MPPRHAYWTILVDDQPTAFRAADRDDLQPTFKRLQEKHPSARMVWFQNGKVWNSREDAQEAMRARGEMGRRGDVRQSFRDRPREPRPEQSDRRDASGKLEWKPKGDAAPRPRPEWRPKTSSPRAPGFSRGRTESRKKLEWQPKGAPSTTQDPRPRTQDPRPEKRKWIPKEEYQKSHGAKPRPRDKTWRPGGEHRDPRQKYKDAKKAKWTRFKQNVRKRWEAKPGRKKKDEK